MFPGGRVIAGPQQGVALYPGVTRARDDERALLRSQSQQSFARSLYHQRAIGIVYLAMQTALPPARVNCPWWHSFVNGYEDRRLIHIRPDASYTSIQQGAMLFPPPHASLRVSKIGKDTNARPDRILIVTTQRRFTIQIAHLPITIDWKVFVNLHACINNTNYMKAFGTQFGKQPGGVGKMLAVPGKDAIAVKRINIQVERVARNIALTKGIGNRSYLFRRLIAEAALSITQRP